MKFIAENAKVVRIKEEYAFGRDRKCKGITVIILTKLYKEKDLFECEVFFKAYNPDIIRLLKEAITLNTLVDLEGHIKYSRYEPKGVINTMKGNIQHSQGQFDFIISKIN